MKKFAGIVFALAFVFVANVAIIPQAHAETGTTNIASLTETLKTLMAKVAALQAELAKIRGEVRDAVKDGLKEGMTHDDIREIQELLASDTSIYPEGKATGYFGALTKEAIKRFQKKHELAITGEINQETRTLLNEYLQERKDGKVPQGLLKAPGIWKKVHDRACDRREERGRGNFALFCKNWQDDDSNDDDEDEDEDEDEKEDEDEDDDSEDFDVEVEIEDEDVTVSFKLNGKNYSVEVNSTSESKVLEEVSDKLNKDLEDIDADLIDEIKQELEEEVEDYKEEFKDEDAADEAIEDAENKIKAIQKDINNAADDVDTDDAQDALDDAKSSLEEAKDEFDDEDYEDALDEAEEALDEAEKAEEELDEAQDEASE